MGELEGLLQGIVEDPTDTRWLVLADWLEEWDDPSRSELLRLSRQLLATCLEPKRYPERAEEQDKAIKLLTEGLQPCMPQRTLCIGESIGMTFNFIPPGTFLMGSPKSETDRRDNETQHEVSLTRGYWLGVHAVTQGQWATSADYNPSIFPATASPVDNVSWYDCLEFAHKLGMRVGHRFRLPTEAEWEYACRAGTSTPFYFGETASTAQFNFNGNFTYGSGTKGIFRQRTMPVGSFVPNAFGLYDMHGNVCEWCQDWYGDFAPWRASNPQGVVAGNARVLRGGSWSDLPCGRSRGRCHLEWPAIERQV